LLPLLTQAEPFQLQTQPVGQVQSVQAPGPPPPPPGPHVEVVVGPAVVVVPVPLVVVGRWVVVVGAGR
jgi:hypothetical protein